MRRELRFTGAAVVLAFTACEKEPIIPPADIVIAGEIVFAADSGNAVHLFKMKPDGSEVVQLTHGNVIDSRPRISPDGKFIAFVRSGSSDEIWVVDARGTAPQQLTADGLWKRSLLTWSPDGSKIVYSAEDGNTLESDIVAVDVATSQTANLTAHISNPGRRAFSYPDWSSQNELIFLQYDTLYWMHPAGEVLRKISYGGASLNPRWSKDGTRIAFTYFTEDDEGDVLLDIAC